MVDSESSSLESSAQTNAGDAEVTINKSRRRLTGAVGVSAIFTLASRPVLANQCVAASAAASGNLSHHGTPPQCNGQTTSFWSSSQNKTAWPSPYQQGTENTTSTLGIMDGGGSSSPAKWSGGTTFHPEFFGTKFMANNQSLTMNQVMVMNNNSYLGLTDNDNLGAHCVAALLNAASGRTPDVLTVEKVKTMWSECQTKGYFEPIAGVKWSPAQVVTYLKTTMI